MITTSNDKLVVNAIIILHVGILLIRQGSHHNSYGIITSIKVHDIYINHQATRLFFIRDAPTCRREDEDSLGIFATC